MFSAFLVFKISFATMLVYIFKLFYLLPLNIKNIFISTINYLTPILKIQLLLLLLLILLVFIKNKLLNIKKLLYLKFICFINQFSVSKKILVIVYILIIVLLIPMILITISDINYMLNCKTFTDSLLVLLELDRVVLIYLFDILYIYISSYLDSLVNIYLLSTLPIITINIHRDEDIESTSTTSSVNSNIDGYNADSESGIFEGEIESNSSSYSSSDSPSDSASESSSATGSESNTDSFIDGGNGYETDNSLEGYIDVENPDNWDVFLPLIQYYDYDIREIFHDWNTDLRNDLFNYFNWVTTHWDNEAVNRFRLLVLGGYMDEDDWTDSDSNSDDFSSNNLINNLTQSSIEIPIESILWFLSNIIICLCAVVKLIFSIKIFISIMKILILHFILMTVLSLIILILLKIYYNMKIHTIKIIQLIKYYIILLFSLFVSSITLINNSINLLMVTPLSISENSSTLIDDNSNSVKDTNFTSDILYKKDDFKSGWFDSDLYKNVEPKYSAIKDNLTAREEATIHLNQNYGIRFTEIMSKKALKGDEIFGSEYGFGVVNRFTRIKNSLTNLISKKKDSEIFQNISNSDNDLTLSKTNIDLPIIVKREVTQWFDISTANKSCTNLNEQIKIPREQNLELKYDPLSELQNTFLDELDSDILSPSSLEVNVNNSNITQGSSDINNIIKSSFIVPSINDFSMLTIVFNLIDDWKYLYFIIFIWYLFKMITFLRIIIRKIKYIITSYFKFVVKNVISVVLGFSIKTKNENIENKTNLNSFLNLDNSETSKDKELKNFSKDTTNLKDMDNSFLNLDTSETSSISNSLLSIYGEKILKNSTENLEFITKIEKWRSNIPLLDLNKPLPSLPNEVINKPLPNIPTFYNLELSKYKIDKPLPKLPDLELTETTTYFKSGFDGFDLMPCLNSLYNFYTTIPSEILKFIYLLVLLIILLVRNWKVIKSFKFIFNIKNLRIFLMCISIFIIIIRLIYLFDISWVYNISNYISNVELKSISIPLIFYPVLKSRVASEPSQCKYFTPHPSQLIYPFSLSVLGFSINKGKGKLKLETEKSDETDPLDTNTKIKDPEIKNKVKDAIDNLFTDKKEISDIFNTDLDDYVDLGEDYTESNISNIEDDNTSSVKLQSKNSLDSILDKKYANLRNIRFKETPENLEILEKLKYIIKESELEKDELNSFVEGSIESFVEGSIESFIPLFFISSLFKLFTPKLVMKGNEYIYSNKLIIKDNRINYIPFIEVKSYYPYLNKSNLNLIIKDNKFSILFSSLYVYIFSIIILLIIYFNSSSLLESIDCSFNLASWNNYILYIFIFINYILDSNYFYELS
jgi:hypothetical protein